MQATELIKKLQQAIEEHKVVEDRLGPLEVLMDVYSLNEHKGIIYDGLTDEIKFEYFIEGSLILSGKDEKKNETN